MNAQLNKIVAQQRIANLQRAAERTRLASEAGARRRTSPESNPVLRAGLQFAALGARFARRGPASREDSSLTPLPTVRSTS